MVQIVRLPIQEESPDGIMQLAGCICCNAMMRLPDHSTMFISNKS